MQRLIQIIRQEALNANNAKSSVMLGIITGYDPGSYTAKVQIYPTDNQGTPALQTGWLPIFTPWVGNGWGLFAPPNLGDIVDVHFQEGSLQNGFINLRSFTSSVLPLPVSSGEFWLVHKTGSFLKLTNDGKVSINGNAEIDITAPIINIGSTTGSSAVSIGDLVSALTGVMNDVAISVYNSHTHNQAGGGITAVPNQLLDSTALTQNLKAN